MDLKKILEEDIWSDPLSIGDKLEAAQEDLLSIDLEEVPHRRFLVDRFPVVLRYPLSDQLELFYDDAKNEERKLAYYLEEEKRFIEVMKRFWSLSPVYIQSNLPDRDLERLKIIVEDCESLEKAYQDASRCTIYQIESYEQIDILMRLSLREKIHACFVFPEIRMMVRTNGLVLELYMGDQTNKELVQTICSTHGLYLRK